MQRGQVTLFVVLGIALVLAVGVFVFVRQQGERIEIEVPGEVQSQGQQEVRQFMDSCIRDAVINGVEMIRLQGGYITIPAGVTTIRLKDPDSHQIVEQNGMKRVTIDPNGPGNDLALWLDSDNRLIIPPPLYIEESLSNYVEKSVERCADGLSSFESQGYSVELGPPSAATEFTDEITVRIDYPMKLQRQDVQFEEKEFIYRLPINLKEVLLMAMGLTLQEYYHTYLEADAKNILMLYAYDGRESTKSLPPITHTSAGEECDTVTWTVPQVKQVLQQKFEENIPYIQVAGYGDALPDGVTELEAGVYKSFIHTLLGSHQPGEVRFRMEQDYFNFDISPKSGIQIEPDVHTGTGLPFLPMFCNVRYQFKYTLKFPVVADIVYAPNPGLNLEGKTIDSRKRFVMPLALGVFVCGNQARKCTGAPAYLADVAQTLEQFGDTGIGASYCDEDKRVVQPQTITLTGRDTGAPVDGTVFYSCVTGQCLLGTTTGGALEAAFPPCMNGELSAVAPGYAPAKKVQTLLVDTPEGALPLELEPYKALNVQVKAVSVRELFQSRLCGSPVTDPEQVAIDAEGRFDVIISSKQGPAQFMLGYPETKEVQLVSGDYFFSSMVQGKATLVDSEVEGEKVSPTKTGPYEGTWMYGSYSDLQASFTYDQLKDARGIVFYVPIEANTDSIDIFYRQPALRQSGDAVFKQQYFDHDCNSATGGEKVDGRIKKEDLQALLRPRLI